MRTIRFLLENSVFLIVGAIAGLVWANVDHASYEALLHFPILENDLIGEPHGAHRVISLHYLVNDILMALFFAIAGKEVWEALLPGGPLSNPKKAAAPLIATAGGVVVPAAVYLIGAAAIGQLGTLGSGWAVPCATDIAFSYMVARLIFGAGHPAIPFLLLLAIADDAIGLLIIAVAYPQEELRPAFLLLAVAAIGACFLFRRMRIKSFWPYLLVGGTMSWFGFALSGLHPALGLLPILPALPHAHVDTGLFDWSQMEEGDTLTRFEHWWKNPVELILGAFGLLNAGVVLSRRACNLPGAGRAADRQAHRHLGVRHDCLQGPAVRPAARPAQHRPDHHRLRRLDRLHRGALRLDRGLPRRAGSGRRQDGCSGLVLRRCRHLAFGPYPGGGKGERGGGSVGRRPPSLSAGPLRTARAR